MVNVAAPAAGGKSAEPLGLREGLLLGMDDTADE
jgi:hypothetical protein